MARGDQAELRERTLYLAPLPQLEAAEVVALLLRQISMGAMAVQAAAVEIHPAQGAPEILLALHHLKEVMAETEVALLVLVALVVVALPLLGLTAQAQLAVMVAMGQHLLFLAFLLRMLVAVVAGLMLQEQPEPAGLVAVGRVQMMLLEPLVQPIQAVAVVALLRLLALALVTAAQAAPASSFFATQSLFRP